MSKKYKVVAIMGKSGSGKDTILNAVCKEFPNLHRKISTTTREPREHEVDGVDYYFTNATSFAQSIIDETMLEANSFNGWFYGTEIKALREDKINIGIFNPEGVRALMESEEIQLEVVYLICNDKMRIIRSLEREENPNIDEIMRRYKTDKDDFSELEFPFSAVINDGRFSIEELVSQIKTIILLKMGKQ